MPLPAESEDHGTKGRGSGEVSVEQGVRPVASSPLARIAAAAQRARGGASPRPESSVSSAAEQNVEAKPAEVTAREASSREPGAGAESNAGSEAAGSASSARAASRVPTPADLMRSGVRPLPAAPVSARGVRLYASSVSEDADPAAGLDEDLRLKLLSALQGMAKEEPREEPVKAEVPKPAAPKPAAPKPVAPKPTAPKPAAPQQAQPAAGESATSALVPAPAQKAEPQPAAGESATSAPAPKPAAPKPLRPTPALFGKVQVSAAESVAESVAEEIAAVDSAEAAAEIEARAASEAELNVELEPVELEPGELEESARIHPQQVREMHENFAERSRPIVLIGPMAAGKTYIGTHLARFYGYEFLDADQLIVERYGEVSEIFEIFGEAHFRELERKTIEEVLTSPVYRNTVFSLGGGAPMTDSVADLLKDECVVYILVDADTVTPRITGNKTRPLLQPNPVERWTDIFERRRSRYEELAHFTLDARGGRPITEMTAEIQAYVTATRTSRAQRPQA
ncbi:shikimate kinase [uncultured Rothia sp.]|uniref:shikimate kinase n=1 Tax=uncultured Rothia sp. TaxID=316088 RepID=UPI00288AD257|nr:shikimate kinase [uncultured Rothia sp.]